MSARDPRPAEAPPPGPTGRRAPPAAPLYGRAADEVERRWDAFREARTARLRESSDD